MHRNMKIPWSRPAFGEEEKKAMKNVIESGWYSQGKVTHEFEKNLSKYFSSNVTIVNSGTSAIICALLAHGIKTGDRVIIPDFTFFATASAPKILGAQIIAADVDKESFNIQPETVEQIVKNQEIKFVIVVDIAGVPVDIEQFEKLSERYNFVLIEDAAEALGSEFRHKRVGSFNHTTTFSFHIAKQVTTIEGGCVVTKDEKISNRILQLRDHGRSKSREYQHELIGSNFRITDLQSSIGIQQLKKIDKFLNQRKKIVDQYKTKLKNVKFQMAPEYTTRNNNMMFFAMYSDKKTRDNSFEFLTSKGIEVKFSWPPIHQQPSNPELQGSNYPNTCEISDTTLMLPIYNDMTDDEVEFVIQSCNNIWEENLKSK